MNDSWDVKKLRTETLTEDFGECGGLGEMEEFVMENFQSLSLSFTLHKF